MNRNKWLTWFLVGVVLVTCVIFASCSSAATTAPTSPSASSVAPPTKTTAAAQTSSVPTTSAAVQTSSAPTTAAVVPQSGGTLNIIANSIPFFSTPANTIAPAAFYLVPAVESLVGLSKDGPVPTKLATSWDVGTDGKSLTLHLRQGVKFQDGTDFDAAAVQYNLNLAIKARPELSTVTSVDVIDTATVKLNLSSYSNTLLYQLSYVSGMIESPAALKAHDLAWFGKNMVGTGPFQLLSFDSPTSMTFKKFAGYWDTGKPYLDGLTYTFIVDPSTAEAYFRQGNAQIWDMLVPSNLKNVASLKLNVNTVPRTIWVAEGDSANPNSPFAKPQVRQAIDYAIDKVTVANTFGNNYWEAPLQPVPSNTIGYDPNFQGNRNYDVAKAKALLADAGYPNGFSTTLTVRDNMDMSVMATYQAYLKAVGINVQIVPGTTGAYASLKSKGWSGILLDGLGISGTYAQILQTDAPNAVRGVSVVVDQNYNDAIAKAIAAPDKVSQIAANQALAKLVFQEAYLIAWNIDSTSCVYNNTVHTDLDTINIQTWNPGNTWLSK